MIIVALECCCGVYSIAIWKDSAVIHTHTSDKVNAQAEEMLSTLNDTLNKLSIGYSDISAYAVTIGPGSFTGIRIGLSAVLGLAYPFKTNIITATTLEVIANKQRNGLISLPAGRGEYYQQQFSEGEPISDIYVAPLSSTSPESYQHTLPNASDLLAIACRKFHQGQFNRNPQPLYIKEADAKKAS